MLACMNSSIDKTYSIRSKNPCLELSIIPPCAGYSCDGYLIDIRNGYISVYAKNTVLENGNIILKNTVDSIKSILVKENIDSINIFINEIDNFNFIKHDDALDVWVYSLKINNKGIFSLNSASLYEKSNVSNLMALQRLIRYLISISPMEIKLREFA